MIPNPKGVINVNDGDYTAAFVTSGLPYERFYAHDTYKGAANCKLIPACFPNYHNIFPYRSGTLAGGGDSTTQGLSLREQLSSEAISSPRLYGMCSSHLPRLTGQTLKPISSPYFDLPTTRRRPADPAWWTDEGYQPNFPMAYGAERKRYGVSTLCYKLRFCHKYIYSSNDRRQYDRGKRVFRQRSVRLARRSG